MKIPAVDTAPSAKLTVEPNPPVDSPGSSIFDLPIQNANPYERPKAQTRPALNIAIDMPESGGGTPLSYVVVSGGTGGNAICSAFANASYVLPVSDDGGSSSEIIRVLGGPSIGKCSQGLYYPKYGLIWLGDIRSRLIRLIPSAPPSSPLDAIRRFLAYRLPAHSSEREARDEWRDIVEGRSPLWMGVPNDRKETIRGTCHRSLFYFCIHALTVGFLVYFESELLKRAHKNFNFRNGRFVGNLIFIYLRALTIEAALVTTF